MGSSGSLPGQSSRVNQVVTLTGVQSTQWTELASQRRAVDNNGCCCVLLDCATSLHPPPSPHFALQALLPVIVPPLTDHVARSGQDSFQILSCPVRGAAQYSTVLQYRLHVYSISQQFDQFTILQIYNPSIMSNTAKLYVTLEKRTSCKKVLPTPSKNSTTTIRTHILLCKVPPKPSPSRTACQPPNLTPPPWLQPPPLPAPPCSVPAQHPRPSCQTPVPPQTWHCPCGPHTQTGRPPKPLAA